MVALLQVTYHLHLRVAGNLVGILLVVPEFGNNVSSSPLRTPLGVTKELSN